MCYVVAVMFNISIDTDPQQQEAASPRMLVVRSFLRQTATQPTIPPSEPHFVTQLPSRQHASATRHVLKTIPSQSHSTQRKQQLSSRGRIMHPHALQADHHRCSSKTTEPCTAVTRVQVIRASGESTMESFV